MRLLQAFHYMQYSNCSTSLLGEITITIESLRSYFRKFNPMCADEAMARAYIKASKSYDARKGEMVPYLKRLAKTVMLEEVKESYVEEIEEIAVDTNTSVESKALEATYFKDENRVIVKELVLPLSEEFLKLGSLLLSSKTEATFDLKNKQYFSEGFSSACSKILYKQASSDFIKSVIYLYDKYRDEILWFLEQKEFVNKSYKEADYSVINSRTAKRISLMSEDGSVLVRPDVYSGKLYLKGSAENKTVCRVRYIDLLYQMELMITSPVSNELVEIIEKYKIVRTCGGSISQVNPDMDNILDLLLDELTTNILCASNCRLLAVGYEYIYLLRGKHGKSDYIELNGIIGFGDVVLKIEDIETIPYTGGN